MSKSIKSALFLVGVVVAIAVLWWVMRPKGLSPDIAAGNGRIEATEIDIAAKIPGRIVEVLKREGDFSRVAQGNLPLRPSQIRT
jgi:HlyD family secretion protein